MRVRGSQGQDQEQRKSAQRGFFWGRRISRGHLGAKISRLQTSVRAPKPLKNKHFGFQKNEKQESTKQTHILGGLSRACVGGQTVVNGAFWGSSAFWERGRHITKSSEITSQKSRTELLMYLMFSRTLSGPLNRLNAILSLLQPLDRYRAPSAIGSAIGRPPSRPISHPHTGGSPQPPRSKPLGGLNRAIVAL